MRVSEEKVVTEIAMLKKEKKVRQKFSLLKDRSAGKVVIVLIEK